MRHVHRGPDRTGHEAEPGQRRGTGRLPRPVLGLRLGRDEDFAETWQYFRDAVAATRPLLAAVAAKKSEAARQKLVTAAWREVTDLLVTADLVDAALVGLRPPRA